MKFEEQTRVYREMIEKYLASIYAPFESEPQKPIFEAANYSLLAGGKRLRPILALAGAAQPKDDLIRIGYGVLRVLFQLLRNALRPLFLRHIC